MISVVAYTPQRKSEWDAFVRRAKNGLFLFLRDYMDYHSDRFTDGSLMFYKEDRLLALLPANLHGDVLASHGGLTFGGVLCDHAMTVTDMLDVFAQITEHARKRRLKSVLYKAIPYPFSRMPAQE